MHELGIIKVKVVNSIKLFFIIPIFVLSSCHTNCPSKIIKYKPYEQLSFSNNKKVVLIGGCFDILHYCQSYKDLVSCAEHLKNLDELKLLGLEAEIIEKTFHE